MLNRLLCPHNDGSAGKALPHPFGEVPSGTTTETCAVIFVLPTDVLKGANDDLARCVLVALRHKALIVGMLGGLLQFLVRAESREALERAGQRLVDELMSSVEARAIAVWTI